MSRSNAMPFAQASATDSTFDIDQPTRRVPTFHLPDEARRVEEHLASEHLHADDATVTIGAEQNRKLLASVFAVGTGLDVGPNTDDEPTLDAPVPAVALEALREPTPVPPEPKRTSRPPPLRSLVLTSAPPPRSTPRLTVAPEAVIALGDLPRPVPAPATTTPESGWRRKIEPHLAEDEARRRSNATFAIRLPKRDTETLVVAGIWATALTLIALLMFIVSSA